jgi:hypothetical protein
MNKKTKPSASPENADTASFATGLASSALWPDGTAVSGIGANSRPGTRAAPLGWPAWPLAFGTDLR